MDSGRHPDNCEPGTFILPWKYLLIGLFPLIALVGSDFLLNHFAWPTPSRIVIGAVTDTHAESAARVRLLAAFLVFVAASVGAVAYAGRIFLLLNGRSLVLTLAAIAVLAVAGIAYFRLGSEQQTQEFVDQRVVCTALSRPDRLTLYENSVAETKDPRRSIERVPGNCAAENFLKLRRLVDLEQIFLIFAIPALVFGAIGCLAEPPAQRGPPAAQEEARRQWEERERERIASLRQDQVHRLNTILYLAAFLLVGGLLFLSGFLHWPAFALKPPDLQSYHANVGSLVLFYGVSYSILIASFYLPAATLLTDKCLRDLGPLKADGEDGAGAALLPPLRLLRVSAAMFSPVIVSLLGEVVTIPV